MNLGEGLINRSEYESDLEKSHSFSDEKKHSLKKQNSRGSELFQSSKTLKKMVDEQTSLDTNLIAKAADLMNSTFEQLMDDSGQILEDCLEDTRHIANQNTLVISNNDNIMYLDSAKNEIVTHKNKKAGDQRMFDCQF